MGSGAVMAEGFKVGEAPWEKQQSGFAVGEAPWEQQVDSQGLTEAGRKEAARNLGGFQAMQMRDEDVVNEMHPDIDTTTRAVIKNLSAGDVEAEFKYLKKNHPNLDFKQDSQGNIVAKRPDEQMWRQLDPQGFQLRDLPQDLLDVAYDIPAGVGQGALTASAGLAAAPTVVGSIPAAMAASGGSGAGLEYIRQKLGQAAGLEQEVDQGQVGLAGGIGALIPAAFGTGATAKQILTQGAKQATKQGATGIAKKELINELALSQRGGLSRMFKGGTSALSGLSPKILENAVENPSLMSGKMGTPKALSESLESVSQGIKNSADESRRELQQAFSDVEKFTRQKTVDIAEAQKPFDDLIAKRQRIFGENPMQETQDALEDAIAAKESIFGNKTKLPGDVAKNTQDRLNELTKIQRKKGGKLIDKSLQNLVEADKEIVTASRKSASSVGEAIDTATGEVDLKGLKGSYSEALQDLEKIDKLFGSPEALQKTFKKMEDPVLAQEIKALAEKYGFDIEQNMLDYYTSKNLASSSWLPVNELGQTNLKRAGAGAATGGALGAYTGYSGGGGDGYGSGMLGGLIGGGLGGLLTGPAATRMALRGVAGAQKVIPKAAPSRAMNLWQQMQRNER
jgi:hypothetical protein